jgi:hypothetical protein
MKFSIKFISGNVPDLKPREKAAYGLVQIGDFEERFIASLNFWSTNDYRKQWDQAIKRLSDGNPQSCLITSLTNPHRANFINWWLVYHVGEMFYFQNQILFMAKLAVPFDPNNPFRHIPPRKTITEDNYSISEWKLPAN